MLTILLESEWTERFNRRIERAIKSAKFPYRASIEEIVYEQERALEREVILDFAQGNYLNQNENILITGSTGVGKSYIATALGYQACLDGKRVQYTPINKLFSRMRVAKLENTYLKEFNDEFVTTEHLFLAILNGNDQVANLLKDAGVKSNEIIKAFKESKTEDIFFSCEKKVELSCATANEKKNKKNKNTLFKTIHF